MIKFSTKHAIIFCMQQTILIDGLNSEDMNQHAQEED